MLLHISGFPQGHSCISIPLLKVAIRAPASAVIALLTNLKNWDVAMTILQGRVQIKDSHGSEGLESLAFLVSFM